MRQKKSPVAFFAIIGALVLALITLMVVEIPVKTQTTEQKQEVQND